MLRKRLLGLGVLGLLLLFFVKPVYSGHGVGKALEDALKSRVSGSIEGVGQQFQKALEQTTNPAQKAAVLFFLADFLMEKQEWNQAIDVYEQILREGTELDKPCVLYGEAQAYLMMGRLEEARAICADIKTLYPDSTTEKFAADMAEISPGSAHAKLAVFFAESPSAYSKQQPATMPVTEAPATKQPVEEKRPEENRLAVSAKVWNSDLSGDIDSKGMNLGLGDDTDIGARTELALNASWKLSKKDQLRLDYSLFDHTGTLNRAVTFDTLVYNPGSSVNLKSSFFDVGFSRLLNESEYGSWKFLYGLKFSHLFMRLTQPTAFGPQVGELNQDFNVPYLGIEGNSRLSGNVSLNGSVKYFSLNQSGASGRLTDFNLALLFGRDYTRNPAETEWYGTLGYRFFLLHGEADNDSSKISYSGPTFGLESRF